MLEIKFTNFANFDLLKKLELPFKVLSILGVIPNFISQISAVSAKLLVQGQSI